MRIGPFNREENCDAKKTEYTGYPIEFSGTRHGIYRRCDCGVSRKGEHPPLLSFTQQDHVLVFNAPPGDGKGLQVGTVTGTFNGKPIVATSILNFEFSFPNPNNINEITFENTAIITDLDGDQILFENVGTGLFINPLDPAVFGIGGPLRGTYKVIDASGKYRVLLRLSERKRTFCYRAVASNPGSAFNPALPAPAVFLGTVRIVVHSDECDD